MIFQLIELLSGGIATSVAYVAWRFREKPAGLPLVVMAVTTIVYAVISVIESVVADPLLWEVLAGLLFPLTAVIAVGSFYLTVEFTHREEYQHPVIATLLMSVILLDVIAAVTNPVHHLMITDISLAPAGTFSSTFGPLFWVHTVISLCIILFSVTLLSVELAVSEGLYRKQIAAIIVAFLIGIGFFLWESLAPINPVFNLATIGVVGWCAVTLWGIFRVEFLETAPIAREALIDGMNDAVLALDTDNRIVDINSQARDQFDIDTEIIGAPSSEAFAAYPSLVEAIEAQQAEQEVILEIDGCKRYFNVKTSPVFVTRARTGDAGSEQRRVGKTVVIRDITTRKERETELERRRELLRHTEQLAGTGGWEFDTRSEQVQWTKGTYSIHDIPPQSDFEPTLDSVIDFYHPDDQDTIRQSFNRCLETGDSFGEELRLITADEQLRWVRAAGERVHEDSDSVIVRGAIQDFTEQKQREHDLKRQNERLDEFASVVSHDLRNPLSVAMGRLNLAREECDSEHLDDVADAHERMSTLIDDLLTLAREGERIDEMAEVNLRETIEECWNIVTTEDAMLVTETERTIRADQNRLRQLFENLIQNAVEHAGEDVTITIGDLDDGFYVADDGPGIPDDKREQVFEAGYSPSGEGTGLGLNIVKEIATAHGWEIRVTESDAGGARFEITRVDVADE